MSAPTPARGHRTTPSRGRTALVLLALSAALAGGALAATPERIVAQKTSVAGFATVKVSTTVKRPATLRVRVLAVPKQNVLVSWTVLCAKSGTSARKVRQFGPTLTPTTRSVVLPVLRADRCTLAATAQLEHGEGRITVQLLARRR